MNRLFSKYYKYIWVNKFKYYQNDFDDIFNKIFSEISS